MRLPSIALAALVSLGCEAVSFVPIRRPPRPMRSRPYSSVQVFLTQPPPWRFVEIAAMETTTNGDNQQQMEDLRVEAAERGCDGILVRDVDSTSTSVAMVGRIPIVGSSTDHVHRAICIQRVY